MVLFALLCSLMAALTGILAVGSGRHWQFTVPDYFRGKRNAILYLWVTSSTIFAIAHACMIAQYGMDYSWHLRLPSSAGWMALHAMMGILLVGAHMFVAYTLSKEVGPVDKYLWGSRVQ